MKKIICSVFVIMFALSLCSCGSKESELVGHWVQVSGDSIEFFKDNTYVTDEGKHTSNPSSVSGTYEITDDGRLKLNEIGSAELYTYTIKNNKLTLKDTSNAEEEIYYLDVKDKKPKEKYLPEDEVIKSAHDTATKDKSVNTTMAEENEKIIDCKYLRNYTDEDGFYHAVYEITKVPSEIDNPYTGVLKYPDFRYFASAGKWELYDVMNDSKGYSDVDEASVLLQSAVGIWEVSDFGENGLHDPFELKITINKKDTDNYAISYKYVTSINEETLKSYREKYPADAEKFKNEISGSLSVSKFIGEYSELFSFEGPGDGTQTICAGVNGYTGLSLHSKTYLNTENGNFELKKTK